MEFKLLGPLEARTDGREVALGAGRQRALLALFLVNANHVLATERIVDALWGERPPETAVKVLQGYVSNLRRAFSEAGVDGTRVLETRPPGYVLNLDAADLDSRRFEELATRGRELVGTDPAKASELLGEALALWRGDALADVRYEEFAHAEAARLEELRLAALEDRIEADLALGRHARLVAELEELVRAHPLRERLREQLMLALYRSGRQGDALEVYRDARRRLVDELGLEPTRRLQELEKAILTQDPALDAPPPVARSDRHRSPAHRRRRTAAASVAATLAGLLVAAVAVALTRSRNAPAVVANSLVAIDPTTNEVADVVRVGRQPRAVETVGRHLWVANTDDETLTQLDTRSRRTRTIGRFQFPVVLEAERDRIWVGSDSGSAVIAIDGASGRELVRLRLPVASVGGLAHGSRSLWAVEPEVAIFRVDLATGRVTGRWIDAGARRLAFGYGALWVVRTGPGEVVRIDAADLTRKHVAGARVPDAVAAGFGAIWVASSGDDTLRRINPFTAAVEGVVDVGDRPVSVAAGASSVWVANHLDGTVSRVDPKTNDVVGTIRTGFFPTAVHVGAGGVWVTVAGMRLD